MSLESLTTVQSDKTQCLTARPQDFNLPVRLNIPDESQSRSGDDYRDTPEVIELSLSRDHVPEKISRLSDEKELHFVIGIGGHHAPPNVRLFSYVLPAIELAQKNTNGKHSLTLTSSLNGALVYNYANTEISKLNKVYWHTREKIAFIAAFIQEFFPGTFSGIETYYGNIQEKISEEVWITIWNEIKRIKPEICDGFLYGIRRKENKETIAYAVRHAFWFLDFVLEGDTECTKNIHGTTVSVGSEKEGLFNAIRKSLLELPLNFLEETLDQTIFRRKRIFQLVFPTRNTVPYGEELKGKRGLERSAEFELLNDQAPVSLDTNLCSDVQYTLDKLKELSGATKEDFLKFLNNLKSQ